MNGIDDYEIRTEAIDFSFGEILNLHKDNEIVIRPEYQRLFRWSQVQRSRLIESILLRLPIPPIFLVEDESGVLELIDGLQRISSVLQFLDHKAIDEPELVLKGCDIIKEINGKTFNDFPISIRLAIKRTPIRAVIIKRSGSEFVKYELFKRLNTGGSLLSAQEIRNCSSRMVSGGADFYEQLQGMAQYSSFVSATIKIPDVDREKRADEELVLRFFAVQNFRESFSGNVKEWLDDYMEQILFGKRRGDIAEDSFKRFFDFINEIYGDGGFSRYRDGVAVGRLAPAYFEAVVGAVCGQEEQLRARGSCALSQSLVYAFDDEDFKSATGPGANTKEKMETRIRVVGEYLSGEHISQDT